MRITLLPKGRTCQGTRQSHHYPPSTPPGYGSSMGGSFTLEMKEEFNRSIKNPDDAKEARELERSGRRLKKSAFYELQEHYRKRMN